MEAKTLVLFEPDENDTLPPGLELSHMLLQISRGTSNRIKLEIENTTNHPISLQGRTVLGRLEVITLVTPMLVKLKTDTDEVRDMPDEIHKRDCTTKTITIDIKAADHLTFLHQFDQSNLSVEQRELAARVLIQEHDVFSSSGDDIGCAEELQMPIILHDQMPVQKTYNAVPEPLYQEVKGYIEDLLNRG